MTFSKVSVPANFFILKIFPLHFTVSKAADIFQGVSPFGFLHQEIADGVVLDIHPIQALIPYDGIDGVGPIFGNYPGPPGIPVKPGELLHPDANCYPVSGNPDRFFGLF
jgi:hypothetical protein